MNKKIDHILLWEKVTANQVLRAEEVFKVILYICSIPVIARIYECILYNTVGQGQACYPTIRHLCTE